MSFLLSLLDEADKVEGAAKMMPGPDFFRAVIYYRAGEIAKGDASGDKALSTITNQAMKTQLSDYLKNMKPVEEKKAEEEKAE